jgi:DNA-binding beta-propeller fold protein YncE
VKLRDQYDGRDDPFEGDRTIVWRSLPENALVTKATLTLEPRLPPGNSAYIETLRFTGGAAYGAMIRPAADGIAEIDFHARRTPVAFSGLAAQASATLSVDIGGNVYLAVSQDGTIPNTTGSKYDLTQSSNLPGIGASRVRLENFANVKVNDPTALASVTVKIASMPSNIMLRFGKRLPFWSKTGDLAVPTTTADITDAIKLAIADAPVMNGYYAIPLIVHSDTLGRLAVTLTLEYFGIAPLVPAGLREVVLAYDYATIAKQDANVLQAMLPAGAAIVPALTSLQLRGAFEASRIAYGPTGPTKTSDPVHCSASETLAQPVVPTSDINVSAIDLLVAADGPAARLSLDLCADFDGKPGQNSLLAKPVPFDIAGDASGQLRWISVPIVPTALLQEIRPKAPMSDSPQRYWVVVQALDGAAWLGVDADAAPKRPMQRSTNAGFSWRLAGVPCPLLLRLRTVPDRFSMPIEFVAGKDQQRASLGKYDALGKIDAMVDAPEIAQAVQVAVTKSAAAPCAQVELLENADFALWRSIGTGLGDASPITLDAAASGQSSMIVVDTFFNKTITPLPQVGVGAPKDLAFSSDGATLFAAANDGIYAIDVATFATRRIDGEFNELAADPRDATLYGLSASELLAFDAASGNASGLRFGLNGARAMVLGQDGRNAYVAVSDTGTAIVALDLVTGTQGLRIPVSASALALSPDGATIFAIDEETRQVASYDAASGAAQWTTVLPQNFTLRAIAAAANGSGVYVMGTAPPGIDASALVALDMRGRVIQSVRLPSMRGQTIALRAKPQGDQLYVADAPIALDPAGRHLVAIAPVGTIIAVPVGVRQPVAWTLTAGSVTPLPSSRVPLEIAAYVANGALSQVVAVGPGCFHDFTIEAMVQSLSTSEGFSAGIGSVAAEAVAELFWLDAGGALLDSISLTLPVSTRLVRQRRRAIPPPATAQAEVRIRVTGGTCILRSVSLRTTDALLQDDAWQPESNTHTSRVTGGGTTYQNLGAAEAAFTQTVALAKSTPYEMDFRGSTVADPSGLAHFELRYQDASGASLGPVERIGLDPVGFARRPASLSVPEAAVAAEIRMVLPPGTSINAESVQLVPRPTTLVPCTFIAHSPGELHVSNAQVVYDWQPGAVPSRPPGGLSPPTPPGSTPGDPECCERCDDEVPTATAASAILSATATPVGSLADFAPVQFDAPLTSIVGIAAARERRFNEAGILTLRDLAVASPEQVIAALEGTVAPTSELATLLIGRAQAALGMQSNASSNGSSHE